MTTGKTTLLAAALLAALLPALAAGASPVTADDDDGAPRLRFEAGGSEIWTLRTTTQSRTRLLDDAQIEESRVTWILGVEATDVDDDGVATLRLRFLGVEIHREGPLVGKLHWEGRLDAKGVAPAPGAGERDATPRDRPGQGVETETARIFSALLGRSFEARIGPRGRVSSVSGFVAIADALARGDGDRPRAQADVIAEMIRPTYGDEPMRRLLEALLGAVGVEGGEAESREMTRQFDLRAVLFGEVEAQVGSEATRASDGAWTIGWRSTRYEAAGDATDDGSDRPERAPGGLVATLESGEADGETTVDATGRLVRSRVTHDLHGRLGSPGRSASDDAPGGVAVRLRHVIELSSER